MKLFLMFILSCFALGVALKLPRWQKIGLVGLIGLGVSFGYFFLHQI